MGTKFKVTMEGLDFCCGFMVRHRVYHWMSCGYGDTFEDLVSRTGSDRKRVAPAIWLLFDAGFIPRIPVGTPAQVVEGTATEGLLIEGTCVRLEDLSDV